MGEYVEGEIRDNPVFTVSDGLFWLYQAAERSSIVRKLQIVKLRGQASVPGLQDVYKRQAGVLYGNIVMTPDGKTSVYRYRRVATTLFLAEGLK